LLKLSSKRVGYWVVPGYLLIFAIWTTHLASIDSFPPFIDELIHIHGSEQGSTESPLTNADLGRQFTIWWMMLFQAHMGSPIWISRVATLLAVLPGVAAMMGIGRLVAGRSGMVLAGLMYLFSAYHFFFGRLALADPIAGSAILLAIYSAYRLVRRFDVKDALLTGVLIFLAVGAKISALPYLGVPIAALLTLRPTRFWREQVRWGLVALVTAIVLILAYIVGLRFFGHDVFSNSVSYALTNRGAVSGTSLLDPERLLRNAQFTFDLLSNYLGVPIVIISILCVVVLAVRRRFYVPLCLIGPLAVIWVNQIQESRFLIVPAALLLLSMALVLGEFLQRQKLVIQVIGLGLIVGWGAFQWLPFVNIIIRDPSQLPLDSADYTQYVRSDASGFGLAEVRDMLREQKPTLVIGLLSNCQGLRYLSLKDFYVECPRLNPSGENIAELVELMTTNRNPGTYVVLEELPFVPDTAPGTQLTVVERPDDGSSMSIYDLAQDS
jgi:hypothetical protein